MITKRILLSTLLLMSGFLSRPVLAADLQILSYHVQPISNKEEEKGIEVLVKAKLSNVPVPSQDETFMFRACLNLPLRADFGFDNARCFSTFETPTKNGKMDLRWDFPFRYLKLPSGPQTISASLDSVTVKMIPKDNVFDDHKTVVAVSGSPLNLQFTMPVVKSVRLQFGGFTVTKQANWDVATSNDGIEPDIYLLVEVGSTTVASSQVCPDSYQCRTPFDTDWFSVTADDKVVVSINDQDKNDSLGAAVVKLFSLGFMTPHSRQIISSYSFSLDQWEALSGQLVEDPHAHFKLLKVQSRN